MPQWDTGRARSVDSVKKSGELTGKIDRNGITDDTARSPRLNYLPVDPERGFAIVDVLRTVAKRHEVGVPQTALARQGVTSVIVGAKRPGQLTENLAAADLVLTEQDREELDTVSANPVPYPDWGQGQEHRLPQSV